MIQALIIALSLPGLWLFRQLLVGIDPYHVAAIPVRLKGYHEQVEISPTHDTKGLI